jgi:hypothetical protein
MGASEMPMANDIKELKVIVDSRLTFATLSVLALVT